MVKNFQKTPNLKEPSGLQIARKAENLATEHLLDAIDSSGFEGCDYFNYCNTDKEKAQFSYHRFKSEKGWHVERVGEFHAVVDWLQGLALNISFNNVDIIANAKKWGSLPENATESQEDKILEKYWLFMAMRLTGLWNKHKVQRG